MKLNGVFSLLSKHIDLNLKTQQMIGSSQYRCGVAFNSPISFPKCKTDKGLT